MKHSIVRGLFVLAGALAVTLLLNQNPNGNPPGEPDAARSEASMHAPPSSPEPSRVQATSFEAPGAPPSGVHAALARPGSGMSTLPPRVPSRPGDATPGVFARFEAWRQRHAAAAPEARDALVAEGEGLAKERRAAMYSLIQTDPELALHLALPLSLRADLPASVAGQLERLVSGRGDYSVYCVYPLDHDPAHHDAPLPLQRTVGLQGLTYRASVYGAREDHPTHVDIPLHGVALVEGGNAVMAVSENPVQWIAPDEAVALGYDASPAAGALCQAGHHAIGSGDVPVLAALGGEPAWFCGLDHAAELNRQLLEEAGTAGGHESLPDPTLPDGRNTYTEGRKRVIIFRVAFSNVAVPAMTESTGINLLSSINDWFQRVSYGRMSVALDDEGSDVVQVTLASASSTYDGDAGALRSAVRSAATASGIDLSRYDFDITAVGSTPSYSWAGLGYVGAPGAWLANGYFGTGVTVHEIGHNLGLPHGNFWDTGGQSDIGPGGNQEYGDNYDVMGGGGSDNGHYASKFKNRLDWVPDGDYPRVTTSGRFRLHAQDHPGSTGLRGLAVPHEGSTDFSIEFRQLFTGNPWIMNGLGLRWGSGSGSQLIDTTPGTEPGKDDSPIVIGRTWHGPSSDVYITPVGKGNTHPESIDVVINFGPFPGNLPPHAVVQANLTEAGTGSAITFSASAADPDDDELAYHWEFGDEGFGANAPVVTHAFSSAGEYAVQCTVSDMKGGTHSDTVIVRIGNPATFRISGRVVKDGEPVARVLVAAGSSSYAYTDSDGTYTITRLGAGSYNVTATLHPLTFTGPWFSNPVTVGPNAASIDFLGLEAAIDNVVVVADNATWRYLDNGSDQGTAWRSPVFNDSGWAAGPAELGYGDDDEATVVSFGPDEDNKYVTTYFRHRFPVSNLAGLTNFNLRLFRDDGGVVYLNGTEILRDNMPAGTITHLTYASSASEETALANVPHHLLVEGPNNVLAVEVHQVLPDSSDLSFSASLTATAVTNLQGISLFYIASPRDNEQFVDPASVPIQVAAFNSGGSYTRMEFFVDGLKIGEDTLAPFNYLWTSPTPGPHTLNVRATDNTGATADATPVNIVVTGSPTIVTVVPAGSTWKYRDSGSDLGTVWREPGFNDFIWVSGPAQLGYGDGDEATVVSYGSNASAKHITTYFRHRFLVDDPSLMTNLFVGLLRDDGGVVYLNGVEVFRSNMPAGTITYTTPAAGVVGGDDEDAFSESAVNPALLQPGTNVLAVEIHQDNQTSSDISFDLYLNAALSGPASPGAKLLAPAPGSQYTAPATIPLAAVATPEPGQTITGVTFLADGAELFTDTTPPYTHQWANPPAGTHILFAQAHLSGGGDLNSPFVLIGVSNPDLPTQLVAPGSAWKYWDAAYGPGGGWNDPAHDDEGWHEGHARLGYGGDGEVTELSFGPDPASKPITAWFRHHFTVNDPAAFDTLKVLFARDDGVVIYLNGTEIVRDNIQAGPVSDNTLATAGIGGTDETAFLEAVASAALLVPGDNVIAAEVHQQSIDSSDLGFDLELVGLTDTNLAEGIYLTKPSAHSRFLMPSSIALEAYVASSAPVTRVDYFADDVKIAEASSAPFAAAWSNPPVGTHTLTARALRDGASDLDAPAVTVEVEGPARSIQPVADMLIPAGTFWRFDDSGNDLGSVWRQRGFNDATWTTGQARLGYGLDGESSPVDGGVVTTYYRRWFTADDPELLDYLLLRLQRDDGAVVYLNGFEIFRSNMPIGSPASSTLALNTIDGLDEQQFLEAYIPVAGSGLTDGTNLVSVEIHQSSPGSSDSGFDLELSAAGSTDRRLYLGSPGAGGIIETPADVTLEAFAHAGEGRSISRVEFLVNGESLGERMAPPWELEWNEPEIGTHTITLEATDDLGALLHSEPVVVQVGFPQVVSSLVPAQSVWNYLDDGSNQGTAWSQPAYNDTGWSSGPARLGYGGNGEATVVGYGPNASSKYLTTYFRHAFQAPADVLYTNLTLRLQRDDGAIVYLNGVEVFRSNMPGGAVTHTTPAAGTVSGDAETTWYPATIAVPNLLPGLNVIAAEVHQINGTSSDLGFDLELTGVGFRTGPQPPPELYIERYLNGRILVRWPQSAVGWSLYQSTNPVPGAVWSRVPFQPGTTNTDYFVVLFTFGKQYFYQLQGP